MARVNLDAIGSLFHEPLVCLDSRGVVRDVNRRFCEMLRRERTDLIDRDVRSIVIRAEDLDRQLSNWLRSRDSTPAAFEWRIDADTTIRTRCDGAAVDLGESGTHILVRCRPKGEAVQQFTLLNDKIQALLREILERRRAEEEVRRQHDWFETTLSSVGDGVIATDATSKIAFMNPMAEELTGWSRQDAIGRSITEVFDIINEITRETVENPVERVLRDGVIVGLANHTILRRLDGSEIPIDDSGAPIRRLNNEIDGAVLVFRNVAERRRVERDLIEREERFRRLADQAPVLIWMTDTEYRWTWFNQPWLEFTGRTMEDEVGQGWLDGVHPEDRDDVWDALKKACGRSEPFRIEHRLRRCDGEFRWVLGQGHPLRNGDGVAIGLIGSLIDVTDMVTARRTLENHRVILERQVEERTREVRISYDRLRLSERLASLGTLSAGLGHDIGNLLLPMRSHLAELQSSELPAPEHEHVATINRCLDYLQRLTNGLRMLAQDPDRRPGSETTELREWWNDLEPILRNVAPKKVELRSRMPDQPTHVALSRAAMAQIVFNLAQNAGEALRGQSDATLEVIARHRDDKQVVELVVADNGPGMIEEVRRQCLEPFFTTKPREFSTGLGLALVNGIVGNAGGQIMVESEAGRGTRFIIELPLTSPERAAFEKPKGLKAVVHLADARLASLAKTTLRSHGFDVVTDLNGVEPEHVALWIVDAASSIEMIRESLRRNGVTQVLTIGFDPQGDGANDRIVILDNGASATQIRTGIRELLRRQQSIAEA